MASKNLLPVVALCGALATGTPVAAWATPVMADSLPAALSSAPNPSSTIACERFSIARPRSQPRDAFVVIRTAR